MKNKPYLKCWLITESTDYYSEDNSYYIYADSSAKAKSKLIRESEGSICWDEIMNLRCLRSKENDLYQQVVHRLYYIVDDKLINHLTNSLGVQINDVMPNEFYRNYSMYHQNNKECDELVKLELMEVYDKLDSKVYYVTDLGIELVKSLLLIKKNTIN